MALKDIVGGMEKQLDGLLQHEEADPVARRQPVLMSIQRAHDQWTSPREGETPEWWSVSNDLVAFSPNLANGAPLTIDGQTTNFIPADRFGGYLASMRQAVENGAFDSEIAAGLTGSGNVSGLATVSMPEARDEEVPYSAGASDHPVR